MKKRGWRVRLAADRDDLVPVAIPTNLKISLTVLQDQSENESLYADTRQLYETFDPSKIYTVSSSADSSDNCYVALIQLRSRQGLSNQARSMVMMVVIPYLATLQSVKW